MFRSEIRRGLPHSQPTAIYLAHSQQRSAYPQPTAIYLARATPTAVCLTRRHPRQRHAVFSSGLDAALQRLGDGNEIQQSSTTHLYRDSSGRTRREKERGFIGPLTTESNASHVFIMINDPVEGCGYALDGENRTATKVPLLPPPHLQEGDSSTVPIGGRGDASPPVGMKSPTPEMKSESLGKQTLEGIEATGTRTTITIPIGQIGNRQPIQIVDEQWYSTGLGVLLASKHKDPRFGETSYRVTELQQGEPDPSLFKFLLVTP